MACCGQVPRKHGIFRVTYMRTVVMPRHCMKVCETMRRERVWALCQMMQRRFDTGLSFERPLWKEQTDRFRGFFNGVLFRD